MGTEAGIEEQGEIMISCVSYRGSERSPRVEDVETGFWEGRGGLAGVEGTVLMGL